MRTPVLAAALLLTLPALACRSHGGGDDQEPAPASAAAQASVVTGPCARAAELQQRTDDSTRTAQIQIPSGGHVLARYYIDAAGRPEMRTFEVIRASESRFIKKARKTAAGKRYRPFEPMPGCPVRGLVVEAFPFQAKALPPR